MIFGMPFLSYFTLTLIPCLPFSCSSMLCTAPAAALNFRDRHLIQIYQLLLCTHDQHPLNGWWITWEFLFTCIVFLSYLLSYHFRYLSSREEVVLVAKGLNKRVRVSLWFPFSMYKWWFDSSPETKCKKQSRSWLPLVMPENSTWLIV